MVYSYKECLEIFGSCYQINKAVQNQRLFKVEKGIYADIASPKFLEILTKKYPRAILTMQTAFLFHGISDVIADQYYLATGRNDTKIRETSVVQIFTPEDILELGKMQMQYNGIEVQIYNKERMLIEAVRYKSKLPFDYYKEVIEYYRNHREALDIELLQDYIDCFPKAAVIEERIQMEVF